MAARIITNVDHFITAVPTAAGVTNFADLETYCESAELWLKRTVLGSSMFDRLIAEIETSSSAPDFTLINICTNIIANHAYWDAVPFLDLVHTESGFGVIMNANKAPASRERVERLRAQCLLRRDAEIENLLAHLEANEQYWEYWKTGDVYAEMYKSLIPTLDMFNKYHRLADRATFDKLHSAIVTVQNTWVADVISKDYIDELVAAQTSGDFTPADEVILPMLRDAIAKLSLAWGIANMSVVVSDKGIVTLSDTTLAGMQVISDARLDLYKSTYKKAGTAMLNRVLDYIVKNIDDFGTFAESDEYAALTADKYENDSAFTIFSSLF